MHKTLKRPQGTWVEQEERKLGSQAGAGGGQDNQRDRFPEVIAQSTSHVRKEEIQRDRGSSGGNKARELVNQDTKLEAPGEVHGMKRGITEESEILAKG